MFVFSDIEFVHAFGETNSSYSQYTDIKNKYVILYPNNSQISQQAQEYYWPPIQHAAEAISNLDVVNFSPPTNGSHDIFFYVGTTQIPPSHTFVINLRDHMNLRSAMIGNEMGIPYLDFSKNNIIDTHTNASLLGKNAYVQICSKQF